MQVIDYLYLCSCPLLSWALAKYIYICYIEEEVPASIFYKIFFGMLHMYNMITSFNFAIKGGYFVIAFLQIIVFVCILPYLYYKSVKKERESRKRENKSGRGLVIIHYIR